MTGPPGAVPLLSAQAVERYLDRLAIQQPTPEPDTQLLRALQVAHQQAVPFENLDIHDGTPIELHADVLVDKLTVRHRGGFCYELNGAFASLLASIGFDVTLMEARVINDGAIGIPFDHLCLRVDLDRPWLVDVGFGDSNREPLLLDTAVVQADPGGPCRIAPTGEAGWYQLVRNETAVYRFSPRPRRLSNFATGCSYHQTSPDSHFTTKSVASIATPTGRVTLTERTLIMTTGDERTEVELTDEQVVDAYHHHFGIELGQRADR